jgi:hypothetical protein
MGLVVVAVFGFLGSCASINSMFKGSAGKLKKAETLWANGSYAEAVAGVLLLIRDDPDFEKAKVFVRDHYEEAVVKTKEAIAALESAPPLERVDGQFNLYLDLQLMYSRALARMPLVGAKESWTWQPVDPIPDGSPDVEKARETAVNAYVVEIGELFKAKKSAEGRSAMKRVFGYYLKESNNDSELEKALRPKALASIVKIVVDYGRLSMEAKTLAELEEAFKTFDYMEEIAKDNAEIARIRATLETRVADVYLSEGKALEAAGDLASLRKARTMYQNGLKKVPEYAALKNALTAVDGKIANQYYEDGYAKEKAGDDASLKAAIELYEKGLEFVPKSAKLLEGILRARNVGAERYYQEARTAERDMGTDPAKGIAVVALYKKAQGWVENYKDTASRITVVQAATTVGIIVATHDNQKVNTELEKALASALKGRVAAGYTIISAVDAGVVYNSNPQSNAASVDDALRKLGLKYIVTVSATPTKARVDEARSREEKKTLYYAIGKADSKLIEMTKSTYDTTRILQGGDANYQKFIDTQGWSEYGQATITIQYKKRKQILPVDVSIRVVEYASKSTPLMTGGGTVDVVVEEEIAESVTSDKGSKTAEFIRKDLRTTYSIPIYNDAAWKERMERSPIVTKAATDQAKAVIDSIAAKVSS